MIESVYWNSSTLAALLLNMERMACNRTCCEYEPGEVICFINYNFTDFYNITEIPLYEIAIRWSFIVPVFLFGLLGNLSIIYILLRNPLLLRTSVNHFILNMSMADLILTCCGPVIFTIRDINLFWVLGEAWCHLEGYIQETVMLVSVLSLTVISFDRMMGVVYPFHKHMKLRHSLIVIGVIWVASGLLAVPFAVYRVYTERVWADTVETICRETGDMAIWWPISMVALVWLPLSTMITCYSIILVRFRRYNRGVKGLVPPIVMHTKKRVVKMMFAVVLVFIFCWTPLQLFTLTKKYFLDENGNFKDNMENKYNTFLTISQYIIYLNPVLDPLIYALMHENFRRAFRITFYCIYKEQSTLVLSRGTGNRGYMWSTKDDSTTQANLERRSSTGNGGVVRGSLQGLRQHPPAALYQDRNKKRCRWKNLFSTKKDNKSNSPKGSIYPSTYPPPIKEGSREHSDFTTTSNNSLKNGSVKVLPCEFDSDGNNNTSVVSSLSRTTSSSREAVRGVRF